MTATAMQRSYPSDSPLFRNTGGARLHTGRCPHILGVPIILATPAERLAMELWHCANTS